MFADICIVLRSHRSIVIRLRSSWPLCCRFAAVLGITIIQFQLSFSWQKDGIALDSRILKNTTEELMVACNVQGSCGGKTSSNHHVSTIVLTVSMSISVFVLIYCVWFSSNMVLCIIGKYLHFGIACLVVVPKVLWFVKIQFCKPKAADSE